MPMALVVSILLGAAWIEYHVSREEVEYMRDVECVEKERQYAEWDSFDFAWFPVNKETNQILSYDEDGHCAPVGFLSCDEARAWIDKNRSGDHIFIRIHHDDLKWGWGTFVKVVYNVTPEWEITD